MASFKSSSSRSSSYRKLVEDAEDKDEAAAWDLASWLSRYSFVFMWPTIKRGYNNQLTLDNVNKVPRKDRSHLLGAHLQRCYNAKFLETGEKSFMKAVFKAFGPQMTLVLFIQFLVQIIGHPMQQVALGWVVRDAGIYINLKRTSHEPLATNGTMNLSQSEHDLDGAYWRVVYDSIWLMLFEAMTILLLNPAYVKSYQIGLRIRAAACRMIYRKSLKLSQASLQDSTVGQMVNLLSNDVNRFEEITLHLCHLVMMPLQALLIMALLATFYLGIWPTLSVFVTIIIYLVLQSTMGYGFGKFRDKTAQLTDERVRLVNEVIRSMQIIKMYAWERPFKALVTSARHREMAIIAKSALLKVINQALFLISSKIIIFIGLETYVLLGNQLEPERVFVTLGLANTVSLCLTLLFPLAVAYTAEASISCSRIHHFLLLPERQQQLANYKSSDESSSYKYAVIMNNVTCRWARSRRQVTSAGAEEQAVVRSMSFAVRPQDLVLIVGRVGSGKSSVLMAILGELPVAEGQLEVNGRISFASQEPWIFTGSVRDNILFGKPFDQKRYKQVLRVCSLERDLEILVEGDSTMVGERGVSLSGGQKARVNLARALYAEADIYILDDPLSAVDAPVARHIFNKCLRTFLRKKTVILATHQLQFLKHASKVLVVDRESPAAFGTLQEVMESEAFKVIGYSKETFEGAEREHARERESPSIEGAGSDSDGNLTTSSEDYEVPLRKMSPLPVKWTSADDLLGDGQLATIGGGRNRNAEALTYVSANWATFLYYLFNAAGACALVWYVMCLLSSETVYQLIDIFLSLWSDSVSRLSGLGDERIKNWIDELSVGQISAIYSSLVLVSLVFSFVQTASAFAGAYRASRRLHARLLDSVIYAPMCFFNFTPAGILLNRFSRDMGFVDEQLPSEAVQVINVFVNSAAMMLVAAALNYFNLLAIAIFIAFTWLLHHLCAACIKKLKQIEGIKRSPIFSHVSTTANGLATVRAFKAQRDFVELFDRYQDEHSGAWFSYVCSTRWFMVHMDWLRLVFEGLGVLVMLTSALDQLNASTIGLLLSLIITLPAPLQHIITNLIDLEGQMTSVQRIKEFSELEPEEPPGKADDGVAEVPSKLGEVGEIKFIGVSLSYFSDEPPVLKGLSFHIKAGEKIGVVGRTGAGKSSIASVLFRLYHFDGHVEIDGCDTKLVQLASLRRAISIIPQDPVLFSCSVRKNLDPFDEYQDQDLWRALEAVKLSHLVARYPQQLEFIVQENGANFSVGQRQLLCLARAILRRNKILLMDEATANVDPETDSFIQRTIGRQFAHCTVITIAHRLITIAKTDRVLVLDQGEVKEFDKPVNLIRDETSLFSQMVNSLSARQAADLEAQLAELNQPAELL